MDRIPMALAAALLAGVLARFGLDAFLAAADRARRWCWRCSPPTWSARRCWPRYAVPACWRSASPSPPRSGELRLGGGAIGARRCRCSPRPSSAGGRRSSLALPLFVVTMASQNLPGVAAIRAAGYTMPISKIITLTGVATLLLAPFGAFALNLAAITAAICMGREAHDDPAGATSRPRRAALIYCVDRPVRRGRRRRCWPRSRASWWSAIAGPGAARHHRRRPGRGAEGRGAPRGRADHLPGHALRASTLRGRRLGVLGRGRRRGWRSLCNSGGPRRDADRRRPRAMKLLFVADPLEAFKTYKDTTFAMMREAARARPRAARLRAAATWSGSAAAA